MQKLYKVNKNVCLIVAGSEFYSVTLVRSLARCGSASLGPRVVLVLLVHWRVAICFTVISRVLHRDDVRLMLFYHSAGKPREKRH